MGKFVAKKAGNIKGKYEEKGKTIFISKTSADTVQTIKNNTVNMTGRKVIFKHV